MNSQPDISIITVCLNSAATLERTLQSVLNQRGPKIEYIVIDGDSSDNTLDILNYFKGKLDIIVSEPDKGIYDAMNKGLKLATGEIIGLLNADDYYINPNVLQNISSKFDDPTIDAVFGDIEYFRSDKPQKAIRTYRSQGFSPKKLKNGLMPAHPALFLRKSIYDKYGLFDPSYKMAGDFEFVTRIFKNNTLKSIYLPEILVRMQMGGISTRGFKSHVVILQENMRACRTHGISTNYFKLILRYPKKLLEYFC